MPIELKRIYERPDSDDGYRLLVDRLWPRGVSKEAAKLDEWAKDLAPSTDLRKWFHQNTTQWKQFRTRYISELEAHREALQELSKRAQTEKITLLFSARDEVRNNAVVLKEFLERLGN